MSQNNNITADYILQNEINPGEAVKYLDEMFLGWLGSSRCSDSECTNAERNEIGVYYHRLRELLTLLSEDKTNEAKKAPARA